MKRKSWFAGIAAALLALVLCPAPARAAESGPAESSYPEGTTTYYNGQYYKTLVDALTGVYMSSPTETAEIYCKPGADVGEMTHGHVADDIVIYGNDAFVSAGERDLEIDTYKYNRATGKQDANGAFLEKDVTVTVKSLNGIAAWGQRHTSHTINLVFEDCQDMQRIYFTNTANPNGKINITLDGCSFDGTKDGKLVANIGTTVYSNADGDIAIKNTAFNKIAVALNINHKSAGTQNISLENCTFTDCATPEVSTELGTTTYGAPVRVVSKQGATTNLKVSGCSFVYNEGNTNCGNGDILIGDGRHNAPAEQGVVTLAMTGTDADVMVQKPGYYGADGSVADEGQGTLTEIPADAVVTPDEGEHFEVDAHDVTEIVNAKDATCTSEGYTGDKVCATCGKVIELGTTIAKLDHAYADSVCTVCGAKDPNYVAPEQPEPDKPGKPGTDDGTKPNTDTPKPDKPGTSDKPGATLPQTGDASGLAIAGALFVAAACGAGALALKQRSSR